MNYEDFLKSKRFVLESSGFDIDKSELNPMLYEFQKDIVRWALKKGKACIFADCGLGKTPMQLSWAHQVCTHAGGMVLILAPLAVADQTKREAEKFGYTAKVVESQSECISGINITNYEKMDKFVANEFVGQANRGERSFMSMVEELESETDVRIPDLNKELVRRFGA